MSHEEIVADYPIFSEESIRAVLTYTARTLQNDTVIDTFTHST